MITEDRVGEVYKIVSAFCKDFHIYSPENVQDYVEDVWFKLVDNYDESKSKLSTYVYLLCKHIYFDELKKRKTQAVIVDVDSLDVAITPTISLIDLIADKEVEEDPLISEIYEKCSPMLRDRLNGVTQRELAVKYNTTQSRISRLIKKELNKLREELS